MWSVKSSLVAYFSATGITKSVANKIAELSSSDVFEIEAKVPYSNADIRYTNPLARCNKEKIGKKDVPIASTISDLDKYDTIYLGFPLWYWNAPNIVITFLKSYDFSNKKIVVFATSGGSNLGKTCDTIKSYVDSSTVVVEAGILNGASEFKLKEVINLG